jgi:hypothetical protein
MRGCILAILAFAVPSSTSAQTAIPYAVVFDSYMTPAAGAQDLVTLQHLTASAEDRWLPARLGTERSRSALAMGILYRSGKFFALDMPQDHMLMVVAHEVFGHGARFRELGEGSLRYGFDVPIPYGPGGAFTRFNGSFPISPLANMNASAAGIEAQHSLADAISERAVDRGQLHYREAWLYFESRMTAVSYIQSASAASEEGHDPSDFLHAFHEACTTPCAPATRKEIQRRSLLALADPLLYYALYGLTVSYIGNGSTTGPMPLLPVGGGVRIMPSLGYTLVPYGTEWTLRGAVQHEGKARSGARRITNVSLRIGDTGASSTWGIGVRAGDVLRVRGVAIDLSIEAWRQPELLADQTSDAQHTGVSAMGTLVLPMPRALRSRWSEGILISAGYKSQGFVPGEQLSGGGVLRAGITMSAR